ncbi:hypothetical protein ACFL1Q_00490 [Patescibacteria group bacterium]
MENPDKPTKTPPVDVLFQEVKKFREAHEQAAREGVSNPVRVGNEAVRLVEPKGRAGTSTVPIDSTAETPKKSQ